MLCCFSLIHVAAMKASTPTRTPSHTPTPSVKDEEVSIDVEGETKAEEALDVSHQRRLLIVLEQGGEGRGRGGEGGKEWWMGGRNGGWDGQCSC